MTLRFFRGINIIYDKNVSAICWNDLTLSSRSKVTGIKKLKFLPIFEQLKIFYANMFVHFDSCHIFSLFYCMNPDHFHVSESKVKVTQEAQSLSFG